VAAREQRKKKPPAGRVDLSPIQALELRLLEFQVSTARAALENAVRLRDAQAVAITKSHGIDVTKGDWHIDTDAGFIEPRK
jgi:hypothetical protein